MEEVPLRQISLERSQDLDAPIALAKIKEARTPLAMGKTPDPDRLPFEFTRSHLTTRKAIVNGDWKASAPHVLGWCQSVETFLEVESKVLREEEEPSQVASNGILGEYGRVHPFVITYRRHIHSATSIRVLLRCGEFSRPMSKFNTFD
ncbi:hypothetical protein NDU88_005462 [Pleurodeles waltl]|uniref:Uncharacterized protein n=1 Tax=Pleurodeles waltl TaxID=8319 RepID=A0AAV7QL94_PLEWA|nr:hypothetical protein NDU88_005462 [Pleurodeles waltl]